MYKHFCFSSGSLEVNCSCDVNQKYYTIFHWFPNHLFSIDDVNTKFSYIYAIEMRKSSLWKTSRWNARLIYTINKNNNKNNNCCFCILRLPNLWKVARQFKILAILYFYCFIIIFNPAMQQVLLVIELTKVEIFFSIPFAFENI